MLFFEVCRTFTLANVKHLDRRINRLTFEKGEMHAVHNLRDGNLDNYCDNNDINAKAEFLKRGGWIKEHIPFDNVTMVNLVNYRIFDCLSRE